MTAWEEERGEERREDDEGDKEGGTEREKESWRGEMGRIERTQSSSRIQAGPRRG